MSKSPTLRLLFGLLITMAAVAGFSWYTLYQVRGLRKLQSDTIDLNRHDSLHLERLQNDINQIGLRLRDMLEEPEGNGIARYRQKFDYVLEDLNKAVLREAKLTPLTRGAGQQAELLAAAREFWGTSDMVFAAASAGHEEEARNLATNELFPQQEHLASLVSALLQRNNTAEEETDRKVSSIYHRVERDIYIFLAATMLAILVTSLYLIYSNRRIFGQLQTYSRQHRVLSARLISVQEEVLRSVSRELHDEFGQILTAVGAMLTRAERKGVPPDSPLRTELAEIRGITHDTLEKIRSLSQMLHPAVIDDYGLAKAVEWYTEVFERQTSIETKATITGLPVTVRGKRAIHCFRIVQEALNNAAKHSGTKRAEVDLQFGVNAVTVMIRDFGRGIPLKSSGERNGLGLIAMHERAELINGNVDITGTPGGGTTVTVTMPLPGDDAGSDELLEETEKELAQHE